MLDGKPWLMWSRGNAGGMPITLSTGHTGRWSGAALPQVTASQVDEALDYPSLVARLRSAFLDPPTCPPRTSLALEAGGSLLVMPAARPSGLAGVKVVTVHPGLTDRPGGAVRAFYLALDATSGTPLGLVDGHALTVRRTAAASVLAASALARADARRLLIVGAGAVAAELAHAYAALRPIEAITVWARRTEAAKQLAAELADKGLPVVAAHDLDTAVAHADIVSAATLSRLPLIRSMAVRDGTHVDLVGGFTAAMREADDALVARARVVADGAPALEEAGDLAGPIASGALDPSRVTLLADALRGYDRRPGDVTLFKSVGLALEDLAAAELLFERLGAASPQMKDAR